MGTQIIAYTVSTLLGVLASLGAWWIVFHYWRPVIKFSPAISKRATGGAPVAFAYRVKLYNTGRRMVVDVTYEARFRVFGLDPHRPSNYEATSLPVSFDGRIAVMFPQGEGGLGSLIRVSAHKPQEFSRPVYPEPIRERARNGALSLDDLLGLGSDATVQIIAFGSDGFSGSRRAFFSPEYRLRDIQERAFKVASLELA
jgi:hypothetical protein